MRKTPFLICMLMILTSLSGCFGGNDVETSEGDDVVLGESTDDWPTYYVLTANDLPTCDANTLGRLYYVEADTNFQACMSTGWQVVQLGGASGNIVVNYPPIVEANIWFADDDLIIEDGDGTYTSLMGIHWNASDLDGTISQIGIDYDGDGVIDIPLTTSTGAFSDLEHTVGGEVLGGLFGLPTESGTTFHKGQTTSMCVWGMTRTFTVMAVDNDGATSLEYITVNAFNPHSYAMGILYNTGEDALEINSEYPGFISQADYDWIMGDGTSTCTPPPQFTLTFDSGAISSGSTDQLGVLTLIAGAPTNIGDSDGCSLPTPALVRNGDTWGYPCGDWDVQYQGADSSNPTVGDTWIISENGVENMCDPSDTDPCTGLRIHLNYDGFGGQSDQTIHSQ